MFSLFSYSFQIKLTQILASVDQFLLQFLLQIMKTFFIFLLQQIASQNHSNYISNINVLLPLTKEKKVVYEIEAYNGCFSWSSSAPHIISVQGIAQEDGCFSRALLKMETSEEQERIIWITATDKHNGHKLTCEAKVAKIQRIQILTKKKTVLVEDLETLELQAYDAKGNVFSSLEGIHFIWSIKQHKANAEFLSLKKALKKTSQLRHDIEQRNFQSDIVILKGLENGVINVNAKIYDEHYSDINTSDTLYIIENFLIYPFNDVQVLPCQQLQFDLYKIKLSDNTQKFNQISLPSSQFEWSVDSQVSGQMMQSGMFTASKLLGQTQLLVMDSTNKENRITTKISVVNPQSIELQINPYDNDLYEHMKYRVISNFELQKKFERFQNNWNLVQGRKYIIKADLLDEKGRLIETSGLKFNFSFSKNHVALFEQFGNVLVFSTIDLANSDQIIVEMPTQNCLENTLISSKSFSIHSQVVIFKLQDQIHLPWQEGQSSGQIYQFAAFGGSKTYEWSTTNASVGTVNSQGVFEARALGRVTIRCSDRSNNSNYDQIEVIVERVREVRFSNNKKELLLNMSDAMFVTAIGDSNKRFANCTNIDVEILPHENLNLPVEKNSYEILISQIQANKLRRLHTLSEDPYKFNKSHYDYYLINGLVSEEDFNEILKNHQNNGFCRSFNITPKQQGQFELKLKAKENTQEIAVMVFKKPELVFPEGYNKSVFGESPTITPGSSISYTIQDGIRTWGKSGQVLNKVFYQNLNHFDVQVQELDQNSTKVTVTCLAPHTSPQQLQIQSYSSEDFSEQLITVVDFTINCKDPSFIAMVPKKDIQNHPENLLKLPKKQFDLQNEATHLLTLTGFTEQNTPFWNSTSIVTEWHGSSALGTLIPGSQNEANIQLNKNVGEFQVTASSNHYNTKRKFPSVENTVKINSFTPLKIEEGNTVILTHPQNTQTFNLKNGSGNFQVTLENPSVAQIIYDPTNRTIKLTPLKEGDTNLIIKDLNLDSLNEVKFPVNFVNVDQIVLAVDEKVKVRGSLFVPKITFKTKDIEIPQNQLKFINYEIQVGGKQSDVLVDDQSMIYIGKQGKYNVNVLLKDSNLYSNTVEITAFDYIQAFPSEIYSASGCKSLLKIIGGPDSNTMLNKDFKITMHQDNKNLTITKIKENIYEVSSPISGSYEIQIGLWQKDQQVSHSKARIVIGNITGVYLNIPEVVYKGSTARGLAIPQIDTHLMSPGTCNLQFDIENLSPQNLQVNKKHHFRAAADQNFSIVGFNIHAVENGVGNLKVSLKIKDSLVASSEQQISIKERELQETANFLDTEKCCKNCASFILMKPDSSIQLKTHKMLDIDPAHNCSVINSVIKCGNKLGNQILIENSEHGFLNASVLSVQSPESLIVQNAEKQQLQSESIKLDLNILYLNKQGYVFQNDNVSNEFQFLVSDTEVLNAFIHKNKLTINTQKQGFSYIYVQSLVYPHLFDIFEVNVGKFVNPSGLINIHVGDEISFENLQNKTFSEWRVSDKDLAQVSPNGKFRSLKEGKVDVQFGDSGVTVAQVKNRFITQLKPLKENPSTVTNISSNSHYKKQYDILFEGFEGSEKIYLLQNEKVSSSLKVECSTQQKFLITSPIIEREKGIFGCSVSFDKKQEVNESSGSVKIVLKSLKNDSLFVESRHQFQVVTLFQFQKGVSNIYLNKSQRTHKLRIKTNHALQVSSRNDKNLSLESNYDSSNNLQTIVVKANGDQEFDDVVVIKSELNQQTQEIKVNFKKHDSWFGFNFSLSNWLDWIIMIAFIWVVLYFLNQYYKKTQENQPYFQRKYTANSTNISNISGLYGGGKDNSHLYQRNDMNNSLFDSGVHRRNNNLYQ